MKKMFVACALMLSMSLSAMNFGPLTRDEAKAVNDKLLTDIINAEQLDISRYLREAGPFPGCYNYERLVQMTARVKSIYDIGGIRQMKISNICSGVPPRRTYRILAQKNFSKEFEPTGFTMFDLTALGIFIQRCILHACKDEKRKMSSYISDHLCTPNTDPYIIDLLTLTNTPESVARAQQRNIDCE
ncbi:MAG: hypothetical protein LBJ96_02425 [Holosporaceae bacterium]|jgi:hypothetical protein|nr:hypothetical protein [Holosporaceae bacterium]